MNFQTIMANVLILKPGYITGGRKSNQYAPFLVKGCKYISIWLKGSRKYLLDIYPKYRNTTRCEMLMKIYILAVWDQDFSIIVICVSRAMFLKGMDERFLLFKDECLTPDIDKGMAVNIF